MVPQLDDSLVEHARKGKPDALRSVLARLCPIVTRMSMALAGREDVARGIVTFVLRQGARRHDRWTDPDAPWRWFFHHTVLTARRSAKHTASASQEVLIGAAADPAYCAFVRAVRLLPEQQREAILLYYCEGLTDRSLAIAMDCSTGAAAAHLSAARGTLATIAGADLDPMLSRLQQVYMQLTPPEDALTPAVRSAIASAALPRRIWRIVIAIIVIAGAAAALWACRKFFRA
jgi:RNA polymerase sigma-70 factor (ECF subfamily)